MRTMNRVILGAAILASVVMVSPNLGQAYSYNAWVGMTGAKTVAVNPFYSFGIDSANTGSYLTGSVLFKFDYGFSDYADIMLTPTWIMPRFDLLKNNLLILGVQLGTAPALQIHGFYDKMDLIAIEYNVYTVANDWSLSGFDVGAIVAPTLKLGNFGIWVEADFNSIIGGFGFDMGAGIYINAGANQISLGVNSILGSPNIGGWLWAPFSFN